MARGLDFPIGLGGRKPRKTPTAFPRSWAGEKPRAHANLQPPSSYQGRTGKDAGETGLDARGLSLIRVGAVGIRIGERLGLSPILGREDKLSPRAPAQLQAFFANLFESFAAR